MLARSVLPRLGGAAAVWNACSLFYQSALLAGYGLAHFGPRWLGVRRHALVHLGLLGLGLLFLPLSVSGSPEGHVNPALWLLGALVRGVAVPFLAVAATAPLLQLWYARSDAPDARDPYPLYAASNLGSLVGLLAYPLFIDLVLGLAAQARLVSILYVALVLLVATCALGALRRRPAEASASLPTGSPVAVEPAPSWRLRARWLFLAAVPASLSLGATTHITTDLAPVPLLWILPLALYLLTFVLAFARRPPLSHSLVVRAQPFLLLGLLLVCALGLDGHGIWTLPLHLLVLFVSALVAHRELALARPSAQHLGPFYLWLAAGGVAGALVNTLLGPLLWNRNWEYLLVLALAAACRPAPTEHTPGARRWDWLGPACLGLGLAALLLLTPRLLPSLPETVSSAAPLGLAALVAFGWSERRTRLTLGCLVLLGVAIPLLPQAHVVAARRSFYGMHRVADGPDGLRRLMHGTTSHGTQSLDPARRREPLAYFHVGSPLGEILRALPSERRRHLAIVGLGTGTIAAYGRAGEHLTFFEIDPAVVDLAREHFTYLRDSAAAVDVVLGDGRKGLEAVPAASLDLIVLDAFSSNAVPTHLLTQEALANYLTKLTPRGLLIANTSNRMLNLPPVFADLAPRLACQAWTAFQAPDRASVEAGASASQWVILARQASDLPVVEHPALFLPLAPGDGSQAWSDDRASIVGLIKWR